MTDVDLADADLHVGDRPHEVFRHLRDHDPLYWNPEGREPGFWSVTRYEDCVKVQKDPRTFSSNQTNTLGPHRNTGDQGSGKMINTTDPPRHTELRKLVNKCFTPRAIAALEPYLRSVVRDVFADALERGECDFAEVVAALPVAGISALLDVPRQDWDLMLNLTSTAFGSHDSEYQLTSDVRANAAQAHGRLLLYCQGLVERRRASPGDDIVSLLAHSQDAGVLSEEECLLFFDVLMLGGNETTRHAAVGGLLALMEHPDQWERLRKEPELVPNAVGELLRWTSPSRHVLRRAARETELHGKTIHPGQDVVIWHTSANRDERVFDAPEVFDVGRPRSSRNGHVAFGSGPHFCLGAALAELELTVFLDELATSVSAAELLGPPDYLRSPVINGVKHVQVRLHPMG
ncbi:cytochrome P450 [Streptosporangium amethystogenes]|uniref:cytochrome P450 n=1 Tax=Streptosporangium amethystogenes TaxID=2002 RepID=UPI00378BA806